MPFESSILCLLIAEDIAVTGIQHSHGRASEQLAASSAEFNLWKET